MNKLLLGFLLLLNTIVYSKDRNTFSYDKEKFIKEVAKSIKIEGTKKEDNINLITSVFESNYFAEIQKDFFDVCNDIVDPLNMEPSIEMRNFFETLKGFENNKYSNTTFLTWFNYLKLLSSLNNNQQKITSFLEWSKNFFFLKIVYKRQTEYWKIPSEMESIENKEGTLICNYENVNIKAYNETDSINIYNTSGNFAYPTLKWNGKNGLISWENVGVPKDKINATIISAYKIDFLKMMVKIDTVRLHNEFNLNEDVYGNLESHLSSSKRFPVFNSFKEDIALNNVMNHFNFFGGIKQVGNTINGKSSGFNDSKLNYKDDNVEIDINSRDVDFKDTTIKARSGGITFKYLGTPILFNNYADFKYNDKSKKIDIFGKEIGGKNVMFLNNVNGLNIRCDHIYYDNKNIQFGGVLIDVLKRSLTIESNNYFDEKLFYKIFGFNDVHPFSQLKAFARKNAADFFHIEDYANYIKQDLSNTKSLIYEFVRDGFVKYDNESGNVTVLDKIDKYIKFANNKSDYDQIRFTSQQTRQGNGILHLGDSMKLELFNVEYMNINSKDKVYLMPEGSLNYYKAGDFTTSGFMNIGPFELYGKNYDFSYKKYHFKLGWIDTMYVNVATDKVDRNGDVVLRRINSAIQNFSGETFINDPNNKSGVLNFAQYPIFTCNDYSYIYWEKQYIQKGEYLKKNFFYKIDPYTLDSLGSFNKDKIRFLGTFVSKIFEDMRQPVSIQDDYSFGFKIEISPIKTIYNNAGNFSGKLLLNNSGLIGKGNFAYKLVNAKSDSILFLPNRTISDIKKLNISESEENNSPSIRMQNVKLEWYVFKDSTYFNPKNGTIEIYDNPIMTLDGNIIYKKDIFTGLGKLSYNNFLLKSEHFNFKKKKLDSPKSDFLATDDKTKLPIFKIDSTNLELDVEKQIISFDFKDVERKINYPANSIYAIANGGLSLDLKNMELQASVKDSTTRLKMVSTDQDLDSLSFQAKKVRLDKDIKLLTNQGVEEIKIRHSTIFPDSQVVKILNGGKIKTLNKARIYLDTNKFHEVIDATINIKSKKNFEGTGKYIYSYNRNLVTISDLNSIKSHTVISMKDSLNLDENFAFFGNFDIYSDSTHISLNGFVKPKKNFKDTCKIKTDWMTCNLRIKKDSDIVPPIKTLTTLNNRNIGYGIYFNSASGKIYPTFSSSVPDNRDYPLITPQGNIRFNAQNGMYEIGEIDRIYGENKSKDYLGFDLEGKNIFGSGRLNFANKTGDFKVNSFGNFSYSLVTKKIDVNSVMGIDFFIKDEILDTIAEGLYNSMNIVFEKKKTLEEKEKDELKSMLSDIKKEIKEDKKEIDKLKEEAKQEEIKEDENTDVFKDFDEEFIDKIKYIYNNKAAKFLKAYKKKKYKNLKDQYTIKMPISERKTILFKDANFHFYAPLKAYVSYGSLNLMSIGNNKFDTEFNGIIYIEDNSKASKMTIFLEKRKEWIYLKYYNSVLSILSSNRKVMSSIKKLKSKEKEQGDFRYEEVSNEKKELKEIDKLKFLMQKINVKDDNKPEPKEQNEEEE